MREPEPAEAMSPSDAGSMTDPTPVLPVRLRVAIAGVSMALLLAFIVVMALALRGQTEQGQFGIFATGRTVELEPRPAPDFVLTTYDGDQLQLSDFRGKVVLLNFWASWCPPCRVEAPVLQDAAERLGPAGLVVIFIVLEAIGLGGNADAALIVGAMLAIDRPLDMARTAVNVYSDSCGAAIIARSEGETGVDETVAPAS